eukprot:1365428-Pyramimonas_sp.AAC.2
MQGTPVGGVYRALVGRALGSWRTGEPAPRGLRGWVGLQPFLLRRPPLTYPPSFIIHIKLVRCVYPVNV